MLKVDFSQKDYLCFKHPISVILFAILDNSNLPNKLSLKLTLTALILSISRLSIEYLTDGEWTKQA